MTKNEALAKCMKMCSVKEYAPSEIVQKLRDWEFSENDIDFIISQLKEEKFIDEYRMARFFANDKLRFNKWGKIKIKYMLQQKGLSAEAINEAIESINEDEYSKILVEEMRKKKKSIREPDDYKAKAKLYQFAAGRGFESDIISKILKQLK
jgi:regulatory protein